jgi:hypothetical protein
MESKIKGCEKKKLNDQIFGVCVTSNKFCSFFSSIVLLSFSMKINKMKIAFGFKILFLKRLN